MLRWGSLGVGVAVVVAVSATACARDSGEAGRRVAGRDTGAATVSPAPSQTTQSAWIPAAVAKMTLEEKVGQLFVPTFSSAADAKAIIKRYHVGGFIYFPGNTRTPRQTAELSNSLQKASKVPLLLGVDEEQGIVSRLPYVTRFPGNMALGATRRPEDARAAARVTGTELRAVGINQDYAPVADVNVNPANPVIGIRSFSSDPALVATMLGPAIEGYQSAGVAATAKHFPGHGDTATDSHTGLPVIKHTRKQWEKLDAPPFRAAVEHNVGSIMSAHIVVPGLDKSGDPSTLSRAVLTGLLRGRLGYRGVIITDSLLMAGVRRKYGDAVVPVRAIKAGADQLLMPPNLGKAYQAVLKAVRSGAITKARLDESVARIMRLKEERGLFKNALADPAQAAKIVGSAGNKATARQVAEHSITLLRNTGKLLPLSGKTVYVTGPQSAGLATALRKQGLRTTTSLGRADVALLTTLNAGSATASKIRALAAKPVVVVALGRPYDLAHAKGAKAALATYSSSAVSISALARVLAGAVKPTGKLPVAVKGHPFGTGLTF